MSDLLIHDLDPEMLRRLEGRARKADRDVADEAKALLRSSLGMIDKGRELGIAPPPGMGFGTWLFGLVPQEFRGDDLVFEIPDMAEEPPDFS